MHRTDVESSNVKSIGFDRESGTLEVQYLNGLIYQYPDTKADDYAALMAAQSKGRHLHQHFVKAGRTHQKVDPDGKNRQETTTGAKAQEIL